jgi:hypothetical protein
MSAFLRPLNMNRLGPTIADAWFGLVSERLPLHNAIWRQSCARSKSCLAFLLTFFNIRLLKNYTYYSIEKIMEDSEGPSAIIGILQKYDNHDFLE